MQTDPPSSARGGAWDSHGDTADVSVVDASLNPASSAAGPPALPSSLPPSASGQPAASASSATSTREGVAQRNITVLPFVEAAGESLRLTPRNETRYQRVKPLGSGAMGEVSLVRDNDIGRTVAVKKLVSRARNAEGIARFVEEIRTIGQLEHPNIVPIHDVGVDEQGQIFFVMKHIDGETLATIIRKLDEGDPEYCARYTVDYRVELALGLLHALEFAHAHGIVHRDIKPAKDAAFVGDKPRRSYRFDAAGVPLGLGCWYAPVRHGQASKIAWDCPLHTCLGRRDCRLRSARGRQFGIAAPSCRCARAVGSRRAVGGAVPPSTAQYR